MGRLNARQPSSTTSLVVFDKVRWHYPGESFLRQHYKQWLQTISYSRPPDGAWLEAKLAKMHGT